ncbi:MAG: stalk domain-containing protein [Defluviitaleaceae bacterium]|nr:stalk domain-containing protein [Defluviitaleaceae bacterium]
MKKLLSAMLTLMLVMGIFAPVALYANDEIIVTIDGVAVQFDTPPQIIEDRTMVPMRAIFEALGATVEWDGETQSITAITAQGDEIHLMVGSTTITINGVADYMEVAPQLVDDRTLVPARFVAQAMGANVVWDNDTRTVIITTHRDRVAGSVISAGSTQSFAIDQYGTLWGWGYYDGDNYFFEWPIPVTFTENVISVSAGNAHTLYLTEDGYPWYLGTSFVDHDYANEQRDDDADYDMVVAIAAGGHHGLMLCESGFVWSWGENASGQLGIGTRINYYASRLVDIPEPVVYIAAGDDFSFAITESGTLWGWGANGVGELGDTTDTDRLSPVEIKENVAAVSAGHGHTMAITTDGTLWTWGFNIAGQLGDGTTRNRHMPVRVMEDVVAVSAGIAHSLAITSDGTLWAWGSSYWGQLGDGTTTSSPIPIAIKEDVVAISAGHHHSLALTADGTLWAWGRNNHGQLGDDSYRDRHTPTLIMGGMMLP